ncbi:META domain-containing protein [Acinetobacter nectaris]|uniref:META domain-containing protein n=1 Tax=Acinetobacter nectaris TaxID=1219382 RepID=UPI001F28EA7C|nr:META domain-containing protein [Acinetobacter nectaris]MCF9034233.1 META domain-containing protein [Acinetobacter nectaris]
MNKKYFLLAILPFALSACQSFPTHLKKNEAMIVETQSPNLLQTLSDYTWTYQSSEKLPPIVLDLDTQKRILIKTGCNNLMGSWQFDGKQINTAPLAATRMLCPPEFMAQEHTALQFFNQAQLNASIDIANPVHPLLTLENKAGQKITFKGEIKPEAKYKSTGEVVFLEVSPIKKPCPNGNTRTCLQVKQVKYDEQGIQTQVDQSWQILPVEIQGYQHDPSLRKIIRVKRFNTKPQTTTPEYAYIYDMTVEQDVASQK